MAKIFDRPKIFAPGQFFGQKFLKAQNFNIFPYLVPWPPPLFFTIFDLDKKKIFFCLVHMYVSFEVEQVYWKGLLEFRNFEKKLPR